MYEWFNHFNRGETSVEDQPRCGPLSMSRNDKNVEKVHQAVLADCCQTTDEISEITDNRCVTEFMPMHISGRSDDETGCCIILDLP